MARNMTRDWLKLSCHTRTNKEEAVKARRNKRTRKMTAMCLFANAPCWFSRKITVSLRTATRIRCPRIRPLFTFSS